MKSSAALLLAFAVACHPALAKKKPPPQPQQTALQLPDRSVAVDDGEFQFSRLQLGRAPLTGSPKLVGEIKNATPYTWVRIYFSVNCGAGPVALNGMLSRYNFQPGQSAQFDALLMGSTATSDCAITYMSGQYDLVYTVRLVKPTESSDLRFEDDSLGIAFSLSRQALNFGLRNKTEGPIKIDWNQVSFVDVDSTSQQVTHAGVKFADARAPKQPTIVPPTARAEDMIVPASKISYSSVRRDWDVSPLLADGPLGKAFKGASFSLFMPLEISGTVKNYSFVFHIEDVRVVGGPK